MFLVDTEYEQSSRQNCQKCQQCFQKTREFRIKNALNFVQQIYFSLVKTIRCYINIVTLPTLNGPSHNVRLVAACNKVCFFFSAKWKKKTYSKLVDCGERRLNAEVTREKVKKMLRSSFPLYTWYVRIATKDSNYSLKYRLDGFGEMAEWKNDPECTHNMYVYRVAKSKLKDRGGYCTDEDKKKARNIVEDVAENDMCGYNSNYSVDRVAEEVASRLNRDSLHWLTIQVWEWETGWSDWSDCSNVSNVYEFGDKYSIDVYLSN